MYVTHKSHGRVSSSHSDSVFHRVPAQKRPLQYPTCQAPPGHVIPGGHECKFNLTYDLQLCPLPDRGVLWPAFVMFQNFRALGLCSVSSSASTMYCLFKHNTIRRSHINKILLKFST